uniref:Autophagy-related protein n=1 Tax=Oryza punctata TaxID=4537 RepID=A0A0E0LS38_ORYPU
MARSSFKLEHPLGRLRPTASERSIPIEFLSLLRRLRGVTFLTLTKRSTLFPLTSRLDSLCMLFGSGSNSVLRRQSSSS